MSEATDREMLEWAAKAAGYDIEWGIVSGGKVLALPSEPFLRDKAGIRRPWRPRDDDGDALRLATELALNVYHVAGSAYALPSEDDGSSEQIVSYRDVADKHAAARLAIFRAAAELGKAMP